MKIKTSELSGAALDWAVGSAMNLILRYQPHFVTTSTIERMTDWDDAEEWSPRTNWAQGGPIKSDNRISTVIKHDGWWIAFICDLNDEETHMQLAKDELTAAMRCHVASKLGAEVAVPDELWPSS
jgi:hypothetical protein